MQNNQSALPAYAEDEIDLRQLVATLWRHRALLAVAGILGAALGLGASLLSTRYVTEGLFLTPSIRSVSDYKRYEGILANGVRLQQFLQNTGQADTPAGRILHELADDPDRYGKTLKPEFAITNKDQQALGIRAKEDESSAMLGIHIVFEHREPTDGAPAALLSEYVRESIIRASMEATLLAQCTAFRMREQELRNAQIQNEFAILQDESRAANLRELTVRNPDASVAESRQIVSLEKGTERFLSPAAQLVAAEIQIADMKLAEVRRKRDRLSSAFKREYYCQAQQALYQAASGRAFLDQLGGIQTAVFQGQDMSVDIVEQTWNELDVERERWNSTYLSGMRFVAPPEGMEIRQRRPAPVPGVVLGGMLGGMFGILLVLVRAWWRGSRDEAVAPQQG
ncbi:lipopolysaccharide biosynthesis protein [Pseudothauera rhizosphaerae]|uniref:Lipopolysaccharide biosynthesis protein n=2 Tax=Pseudothauera rhizosphaerae TaxID=2565932 RepID=A0A4S4AZ01_9RHOO|nr:lipopolysaccharide biosynthesis protein [Pseudothauera rhizosphaerae]THF65388.1 lipopolysaccharide biosynthesis protein [Pseudothauera rhizosphaerae]